MPEQQPPFDVPQEILNIVGLTESKIANFTRANREELIAVLKAGHSHGDNYYSSINQTSVERPRELRIPYTDNSLNEIEYLSIAIDEFPVEQIPDALLFLWQSKKDSLEHVDSEIVGRMNTFVMNFVEGIGEEALRKRDFQTAVNAYDAISEEGVEKDPKFQIAIKRFPLERRGYQDHLALARAIQTRINQRPQVSANESTNQQ